MMRNNQDLILIRIAEALERLAPAQQMSLNLTEASAFVWNVNPDRLNPIHRVNFLNLDLLKGIDHVLNILDNNTRQFANGFPANNALLWGARGMGKSSLIKALHAKISSEQKEKSEISALILIEIHREDISTLPRLLNLIRETNHKIIIFCDDLSFDNDDNNYKSLKAVLEGGIEGRPDNVIFYATSNRRHLMPREMIENEQSTAINPRESVDEKVSLSDRFGLWLGFHACNQEDYLSMIYAYMDHYKITIPKDDVRPQALEWSRTRGARSGRVAWQFMQDLAGRHKFKL
ncbi:MAG: ATP-binding protein [Emcibacter sp.]|nr:ATP-binding protein [Emcibacter sp.]